SPMPHLESINAAHFSPGDGRFVVTASEDKTARVWDGSTGLPISEAARVGSPVEDAFFSADGQLIRLALASQEVRNFRLTSGLMLVSAPEEPDRSSSTTTEAMLASFKDRLAGKHSGEITSADLDPK